VYSNGAFCVQEDVRCVKRRRFWRPGPVYRILPLEPACGGECEATCCRLAFELQPPRCSVLRYDCDFRQTFLEMSECNATTHLCTCGQGYCGMNVSGDSHMECGAGLGAPCMACPLGSYKSSVSLAACTLCGAGYSTLQVGATRKELCRPLCLNGTYSPTGIEV